MHHNGDAHSEQCSQALMENISGGETHRVDFESPAESRYLERRAVDRVSPLPQGATKHTHQTHPYQTLWTELFRLL